jgi:hypothetical protein
VRCGNQVGPNKGEKLLMTGGAVGGNSRLASSDIDLDRVDYETGCMIIGGGGAGASAALRHRSRELRYCDYKLRLGDAKYCRR